MDVKIGKRQKIHYTPDQVNDSPNISNMYLSSLCQYRAGHWSQQLARCWGDALFGLNAEQRTTLLNSWLGCISVQIYKIYTYIYFFKYC